MTSLLHEFTAAVYAYINPAQDHGSKKPTMDRESPWSPTTKGGLLATDGCLEKESKFFFREAARETTHAPADGPIPMHM